MQVSKLMPRSCVDHKGSLLNLIGLLVDNVALVREHRSDVVFLFLSSNEENFVLSLNRCELLWKDLSISYLNLGCCLCIQLMNEQCLLLLIVIVQSWLDRCQNIVRLKANNIVQKASELVDLRFHLNHWPSIFIDKADMIFDFCLKINCFVSHLVNEVLLLQYLQKLLSVVELLQILDSLRNVRLELFELVQGLICEILWRWLVVLHTLEVADDLLGVGLLLVNDAFEHVKLLVHFLVNFILQTFLIQDLKLHFLTFSQVD